MKLTRMLVERDHAADVPFVRIEIDGAETVTITVGFSLEGVQPRFTSAWAKPDEDAALQAEASIRLTARDARLVWKQLDGIFGKDDHDDSWEQWRRY